MNHSYFKQASNEHEPKKTGKLILAWNHKWNKYKSGQLEC